jgi:hypothetical protein
MRPVLQLSPFSHSIAPGRPSDPGVAETGDVFVVYTALDETLAALRAAAGFAGPLGATVTLVHFRTVPYAQPIDAPAGISPIATEAFSQLLANEGLEVSRRVYTCREPGPAIRDMVKGTSLVFIGRRRGWWQRSSGRMRRALEEAGHLVITIDPSAVEENAHA